MSKEIEFVRKVSENQLVNTGTKPLVQWEQQYGKLNL